MLRIINIFENKFHSQKLNTIDTIPHSLGVCTLGVYMNVIIERNSKLPIVKTKSYTTFLDNQTEMTFEIYEGEHLFVCENRKLGEFLLTGITPLPKGKK